MLRAVAKDDGAVIKYGKLFIVRTACFEMHMHRNEVGSSVAVPRRSRPVREIVGAPTDARQQEQPRYKYYTWVIKLDFHDK
jgi:hypothetical protein